MPARKKFEFNEKLKQIIDEEFSDFEMYMPTLQDKRMYQRKRAEYWHNIVEKLKAAYDDKTLDFDVIGVFNEKLKQIIDDEFADFEMYMPTPQDRRMYHRKRAEYWHNVASRLREINGYKENNDGRTDDTAVSTAVNV